jgi:hypothetical protein
MLRADNLDRTGVKSLTALIERPQLREVTKIA